MYYIVLYLIYEIDHNKEGATMSPTMNITASTPLYLQIEEALTQRIQNGLYPSGSKLPTENELSTTYHVSRVTVRKALKLLEDKGYIDRKVGKGTYVAEKKLQRSFTGNVRSFTLMCEATGMKASAKLVNIKLLSPDVKQQELMKLKPNQQVLYIERVRFADGSPILIERDFFSDEFQFLFSEDLEHNSLYELIRQEKKLVFTQAERTIDIVFSNASESRMLGIKTGYPLLRICSITEDATGSIVTYSEQLCIGDKFKLHV